MTGTLYIVPTPIGNLEDITLRALRVLKSVRLIAAEDTRTSRVLLSHYQIDTPLTSYHEHNKLTRLEAILSALVEGDVALISDAGMPGISDPGYELIGACIAHGVRVEPLPGANAVLPALVGSGLPTDRWLFLGFLPRKKRVEFFRELADERATLIAYESPNRLIATLSALQAALGADRPVCVARELSKKFETFTRGSVAQVLAHYSQHPPRGEIVLVIGGAPARTAAVWSADQVRDALRARLAQGEPRAQAAKAIAQQSGWRKSDIYALADDD